MLSQAIPQPGVQSTTSLLAAPEDQYFKDALELFSRDEALDNILPRFKNAAERRALDNRLNRAVNNWDYAEEAKAWDLVARLSRAHCDVKHEKVYEDIDGQINDGRAEILPMNNLLVQESDSQSARRLIQTKPELRWLRATLDWLECNVDRERLDKVYMWRTQEMWKRTVEREKGTDTRLDPDAVAKCLVQLEQLDGEEEQHLLYGLWLLLRTGRVGWASDVRGIGYSDVETRDNWNKEKARQHLLIDEPNVEPTDDQVMQKVAELQEPLYWYLQQVDEREREEEAKDSLYAEQPDVTPSQQDIQERIRILHPHLEHYDKAAVERLCIIWGQPWRAATLAGGDLSHDPVLSGYNLGESAVPALEESGNRSRRMLWRSMCLQTSTQAAESNGAMGTHGGGEISTYEPRRHHKEHAAVAYEAALYGILGFEPMRAHAVCQCWEDELFCAAKSCFEAKVEFEIARERERCGLSPSECVPESIIHAQAKCLRQSVRDITPYPSNKSFCDQPLAWVERCLIRGDLAEMLRMLETLVQTTPLQQHGWVASLLRFGVHLALLVRGRRIYSCGPTLPEWPEVDVIDPRDGQSYVELCDSLLTEYARYLVYSGQHKLASSYIVLLSNQQLVSSGLVELFTGLADDQGVRVQEEHLEIALRAMQMRDNWSCDVCSSVQQVQDPQTMVLNVAHRVAAPETGVVKPLYVIKWLCVYPEHSFHAVACANFMIRQLVSHSTPQYQDARAVITYLPERIRFLHPETHTLEQHPQVQEHDKALLVNELCFWWEFLAAHEDLQFVQMYHTRAEQAKSMHQSSNEVLYNSVLEGIDSTHVAQRGESAVHHFVACLRLLPEQLDAPCSTTSLVYPILTNVYWLLVTLLPSLIRNKQKEYLEESMQLAVLITQDDKGGQRKIYEHLEQSQLQQFVKLMAISQTELLKYHDQVFPKTWKQYANDTHAKLEQIYD